MTERDVVVLSAVRSAVGTFGGGLSDQEPADLAGVVMKEAVARSGADPAKINYVTVGNCIPTEVRYPYVARVASIQAGLPMDSVAMAVNRLCSSGLQGVVTTAQNILLGDCDWGVGGGVEVMSRGAYLSPAMRSGARMGDTKMVDAMVAALTDPFGVGHMGITAENLAEKWGITREEQDELAAESHRRAAAAISEGRFTDQIVPIVKKTRKGEVTVDTDEHVKPGTTVEKLAGMRAGVQEGRRHGHRRQRVGHQRRRRLPRARRRGGRAGREREAAGPAGVLRGGGRAEPHHGRGPDPGDEDRAWRRPAWGWTRST